MPTPKPTVRPVVGAWTVYESEYADEGQIDVAHRIDYPDGRVAFTIEYRGVDEDWDVRLESKDGVVFRGEMKDPGDDEGYPVHMQLWVAPDDDEEWLLLGTWTDDDGERIDWSINLFVDDEDDE